MNPNLDQIKQDQDFKVNYIFLSIIATSEVAYTQNWSVWTADDQETDNTYVALRSHASVILKVIGTKTN
jgi:hypothetical protein